jgi:hypothetical protein
VRKRLLLFALAALIAGCGGGGSDEMSTEDVTAEVTADTRARFATGPATLSRVDVECTDVGEDLWRCRTEAVIEAPGTEPVETSVQFRVRCTEADGCTTLGRGQ